MKTTLFLCVLAVNTLTATPILVRVTPETLTRLQERDPMIRLVKPTEDAAKPATTENPSIIQQSTILHDGKNWTLVPNDAVVFLPEALKQRVNVKPVGTLLPWIDFLTRNRSWITTNEVTFDQAAGTAPLPAERTAFWAKQDKIVVAVHQNGPISVRMADSSSSLAKR